MDFDFGTFFKKATGFPPYPYQRKIAEHGFPEVIEVPTGAGKTAAVVLGWLYRRWYHPDPGVRKKTPRRLIIAQPMRTLVEQTYDRIERMLAGLGLADEVNLHVMMGGRLDSAKLNQWRADLHKPTIVVATVDCVVSRALNRGYGTSRSSYPIDFALVTNGALVVLDEIQLAPQAVATQRQLSAFQSSWGTAEPAGLVCMSATVEATALNVVDNPWSAEWFGDPARTLRIKEADRVEELQRRLEAEKTVTKLGVATPAALAAEVNQRHRGGLSLVVVNTVETATTTYKALRRLKPDAELMLLHSRFRGVERADLAKRLREQSESRIIISTQVVEAGVDLDASVLITEVAPWSSLVQRAGRCNRTGTQAGAVLAWFDPIGRGPYAQDDLDATAAALTELEGQQVTPTSLGELKIAQSVPELRFIRRRDLEGLFDTTPDLAGRDVDISCYIRPNEQLDLQFAWIATGSTPPRPDLPLPPEPLRCAVSIGPARKFLDRSEPPKAWVFDAFGDRWRAYAKGMSLAPQQVILVDAATGGYSTELGFDPAEKALVPTLDDTGEGVHPVSAAANADSQHAPNQTSRGPRTDDESAASEAGVPTGAWESLQEHLADTERQAQRLLESLRPDLPAGVGEVVVAAAALHDLGKQHEDWQRALCEAADTEPAAELRPVAKSPRGGRRIQFKRVTKTGSQPRRAFRHELVSALILNTEPGLELMRSYGLSDQNFALCRYLVAAHHGRIRLQPRDPMTEGRDGTSLHGLIDGEPLLGGPVIEAGSGVVPSDSAAGTDGEEGRDQGMIVDLSPFQGGPDSWSAAALRLLDELGPFRLAYAETLVRMADWRASGHLPLAEEQS